EGRPAAAEGSAAVGAAGTAAAHQGRRAEGGAVDQRRSGEGLDLLLHSETRHADGTGGAEKGSEEDAGPGEAGRRDGAKTRPRLREGDGRPRRPRSRLEGGQGDDRDVRPARQAVQIIRSATPAPQ